METGTAKRLEGIGEYYFSQKLREIEALNRSGQTVINLGIGSPDLPPHPSVINELNEWAEQTGSHAYQGYKGVPAFRAAISNWYQLHYGVELDPNTEILPLIGSKEGIMHISMTYLNEGDTVLIPDPGYPTYAAATKLAGAQPLFYPLREENDWEPDFGAMENMDLSRVKIIWASYPHMPTGKAPSRELFQKFIDFARKYGILLCHDNPYSFILNNEPMSILSIPGAKEVCIELNSLSKSHNMAGWRIGMLLGSAKRIEEVLRFKSNMDSGMFLPVQRAAIRALSLGEDWFGQLNETYRSRRQLVFDLLDELGCSYNKEQSGLFVWARVPSGTGFELSDSLLHTSRVFITPGGIFGSEGENYIRVSLCNDTAVLSEAIVRIKKGGKQ